MEPEPIDCTLPRRVAAWLVHGFTASGGAIGMLALAAIHQHEYIPALWFMLAAMVIDGFDGVLARRVRVREVLPGFDGRTLDNLIDFLNYVLVPVFFLLVSDVLPASVREAVAVVVVMASAYQFSQGDAKTSDGFFKGFPCYWNILVFYLFVLGMSPPWNLFAVGTCVVLVFVPIKYVYPTRLSGFSRATAVRAAVAVGLVLWVLATVALLLFYPQRHQGLLVVSLVGVALYFIVSLLRTFLKF